MVDAADRSRFMEAKEELDVSDFLYNPLQQGFSKFIVFCRLNKQTQLPYGQLLKQDLQNKEKFNVKF